MLVRTETFRKPAAAAGAPNWAFVTQDSSGVDYVGGVTADLAETVDAGTGSNRYLIVFPLWENGSDPAITAITYNGAALTKQGAFTVDGADNFNETIECWTLANPASGPNTLQFSNSATSQDFAWMAVVYSASGTISFVDVFTAGNSPAGDPIDAVFTTNITSPNMIAWGLAYERGQQEGTWTAAADNTIRVDDQTDTVNASGTSFVAGDRMTGDGSVDIGATAVAQSGITGLSIQLIAVELAV